MSRELFRVSFDVCAVVGAVTLYSFLTLVLASLVIRRVKSRRPRIVPSVADGRRPATARVAEQNWQDRDRHWAVILVLLGAPAIAERAEPFVDTVARRVDWPGLLLEASIWAKGDRLLVQVAYDLCDRECAVPASGPTAAPTPVAVRDLLEEVDQPRTDLMLAALNLRRGSCSFDHAMKVALRTGNLSTRSRVRTLSRLRKAGDLEQAR